MIKDIVCILRKLMSETKVVNLKKEPYDIYIGRTRHKYHYGNLFRIGPDGTRTIVIEKFRFWIKGIAYRDIEPERREWIIKTMESLRRKKLGCYCKPEACHGDVYVELLAGLKIKGGEIT